MGKQIIGKPTNKESGMSDGFRASKEDAELCERYSLDIDSVSDVLFEVADALRAAVQTGMMIGATPPGKPVYIDSQSDSALMSLLIETAKEMGRDVSILGCDSEKYLTGQLDYARQTLLQYNEVCNYTAVRPLYGLALRVFDFGVTKAIVNNPTFRDKLEQFEDFLDIEIVDSESKEKNSLERIRIQTWVRWGNGVPKWVRSGIEPYISEWVECIDNMMSASNRPEYWRLLRGDFGEVAQNKVHREHVSRS